MDSVLNSEGITQEQINFIQQQIETSIAFFQKRLKVIPYQSDIIYTVPNEFCYFETNPEDRIIPNSDFHLFVQADKNSSKNHHFYSIL